MEAEDRFDSLETPPASANAGNVGVDSLQQSQNTSGADETRVHAGRDRWVWWACSPTLQQCYQSVCHASRMLLFIFRVLNVIWFSMTKRPVGSQFWSSDPLPCWPHCPLPPLQTGALDDAIVFIYVCPVRRMPFSRASPYVPALLFWRCRRRVSTEHSGQETRTQILVSLLHQLWVETTRPSSHVLQGRLQGEGERSSSYRRKWATCI